MQLREERLAMHDMQQYVVTEFIEDYEDGLLERADLERRLVGLVGASEAANLLAGLPVVAPRARRAPVPRPIQGGAGIQTADVSIPIQGGQLQGYLARPEGDGRRAAVLAIHENRGLVDHIKDCARRLAAAGYVALAPDLLSREGGTGAFKETADATAALGKADANQNTQDLLAALDWLAQQPGVDGSRLAVTGWCMGGGYTWRVATQAGSRIKAAVPWYGPNPPSDAEKIAAPVFAIYGALDERINAGIPAIAELMWKNNKAFALRVYPNAQHAFNNDQNAERYNAEQAPIAWNDMLYFLGETLK
ncbi:MAG TPA: dienelactone hydrolase family protein [Chloroflexota bacterium]|nr:dienelactone hydrolase family protein [Chloroflexota bacterium]